VGALGSGVHSAVSVPRTHTSLWSVPSALDGEHGCAAAASVGPGEVVQVLGSVVTLGGVLRRVLYALGMRAVLRWVQERAGGEGVSMWVSMRCCVIICNLP
jgi:hypothetical protein